MDQLSSLDAQFLNVESATTSGHVGSVVVLDPSNVPGAELTLDGLRAVIEPRLHLAPPLRQRLVRVPLSLGLPYWVDDPDFDIEFHLREIGLPDPGDDRQLAEQVARIHARPLDQTRPLWEMYLIHHVDGGRQAIYTKMHHAAIDGVSGVEVLAALMDVTVEPRVEEPPDEYWQPGPLPNAVSLLRLGIAASVRQPLDILQMLPKSLPHLADLPGAVYIPGAQAVSDLADSAVRLATGGGLTRNGERRQLTTPLTPLNHAITAHRRFAYGSVPLEQIKVVKNAFGMTVNDVVMAMCTTALRRWLLDHDGLPDEPIVVAVPVSVRLDEHGFAGNQISVMLARMPTHEGDPSRRLTGVQEGMTEARAAFDAVPASILSDFSATVPTALHGLAMRALFRMVTVGAFPFNLFVSNVPGPQIPLYVAGARVLGVYPASAITDLTGALNITLFSYDGNVDFGLVACRELVPDVWNLIDYLREALDELLVLAANAPPLPTPTSITDAPSKREAKRAVATTAAKKSAAKKTTVKKTTAKKTVKETTAKATATKATATKAGQQQADSAPAETSGEAPTTDDG